LTARVDPWPSQIGGRRQQIADVDGRAYGRLTPAEASHGNVDLDRQISWAGISRCVSPDGNSPQSIKELADDFLKSRSLIYATGVLVLVGGLSIVNTHNRWALDWTLIITLFGWAMVIGGASRIVVPTVVTGVGGTMIGHSIATRIAGVIWALIGVLLTFKGYF
jgi:hypothetical protein